MSYLRLGSFKGTFSLPVSHIVFKLIVTQTAPGMFVFPIGFNLHFASKHSCVIGAYLASE